MKALFVCVIAIALLPASGLDAGRQEVLTAMNYAALGLFGHRYTREEPTATYGFGWSHRPFKPSAATAGMVARLDKEFAASTDRDAWLDRYLLNAAEKRTDSLAVFAASQAVVIHNRWANSVGEPYGPASHGGTRQALYWFMLANPREGDLLFARNAFLMSINSRSGPEMLDVGRRLLAATGGDAEVKLKVANLLTETGTAKEAREAISMLSDLRRRYPGVPAYPRNLMSAYASLASSDEGQKEDWEAAIRFCEEYMALVPKDSTGYQAGAHAIAALERRLEAMGRTSRSASGSPSKRPSGRAARPYQVNCKFRAIQFRA